MSVDWTCRCGRCSLGAVAHALTFVTVLCNDGFSGHLVRLTFHAFRSTHHSALLIFCCPMIMLVQCSSVSSNKPYRHMFDCFHARAERGNKGGINVDMWRVTGTESEEWKRMWSKSGRRCRKPLEKDRLVLRKMTTIWKCSG